MNKNLIFSILLFICGITSFYSALDGYRTIQILQEIPFPSDTQANKIVRDAVMEASINVKLGIIMSLILGLASWIVGILLFTKRNNELINK